MSKIEVNQIAVQCGSTLTVGSSGKTVSLASGASQTGFGRTGTVDWCTTAKTSPFTAVSGDGFFVDTSGGAVTVTLPASPNAGDIVSIADYTNTFCTHAVTIGRNGSKIGGVCSDALLETQGQSITLVYVDGTEGWKNVQDSTSNVTGNPGFIAATGGTVSTSGDFKIHTFNADGCFSVTNTFGSDVGAKVSYVVVAGGAGGGGGGGGAGGFREAKVPSDPYTDSPLDAGTGLPVSVQTYPISVGAGGTGGDGFGSTPGGNGGNSIFSSITSTGGGGGGVNHGSCASKQNGASGGSGGGSGNQPGGSGSAGAGNTPPTTPSQGSNGGTSSPGPGANIGFGGGGGATAVGANGTQGSPPSPGNGGNGGAGATTSITASPVAYAGGGGGGVQAPQNPTSSATSGGAGGGGSGHGSTPAASSPTANGTANLGGGGGGNTSATAGTGGSGVVIIRYKFQ